MHHVILTSRWHLMASYNTDFFARIFPTCPMVFGNTILSLKSCCFHEAKTDPLQTVLDFKML